MLLSDLVLSRDAPSKLVTERGMASELRFVLRREPVNAALCTYFQLVVNRGLGRGFVYRTVYNSGTARNSRGCFDCVLSALSFS